MPFDRSRRVGNLPADVTSFVGRRAEVAEVKRLLSTARLVTLTGSAGVGKTRLALRVADQMASAFPQGAWLVRLSQLHDGALVAHTVALALQIHDEGGRGPCPALLDFLRGAATLLVLDDCSHLVSASAEFAASLLRASKSVRILVTSRESLRVHGEQVFNLQPLAVQPPVTDLAGTEASHSPAAGAVSPSPAATLFAERAAAVMPSFELNADNRPLVEELCRRLDGIPLAIELAATRLRVLSVAQILQRIDERFQLLSGDNRSLAPHQRTLRGAVDRSFVLCTPGEQVAWQRASVFAGDFGVDAAEQVCSGDDIAPGDVSQLLAGLVAKSVMLRQEQRGQVRFRLLETLRQYGQEALRATGQELACRRRHAYWYLCLAEESEREWFGPHDVEWLFRLRQEQTNLRAALEFSLANPDQAGTALRIAAALWFHWVNSGLIAEGRLWLDRALALDRRPTLARGRALWAAGFVANLEVDLEASVSLLEQARDLATEFGDSALAARSACWLGLAPLHRGDLANAVEQLERARDLSDDQGRPDDAHAVLVCLALATVRMLRNDLRGALDETQRCRAICQQRGDHTYLGYAITLIARINWIQGQPERAVEHLYESLRLRRVLPHPPTMLTAIDMLAWIAESSGQHARAAVLLGSARRLWSRFGLTQSRAALQVPHEECEARTRAALGESAYLRGVKCGAHLDLDQIITYALRESAGGPDSGARAGARETPVALTTREHQVAGLVAEGLSNKQIAGRLVIAQRTAESHIEHIMTKLGFTSRAQIAAWVVETSPGQAPVPAECNGQ